jgi:hypothetical protein
MAESRRTEPCLWPMPGPLAAQQAGAMNAFQIVATIILVPVGVLFLLGGAVLSLLDWN